MEALKRIAERPDPKAQTPDLSVGTPDLSVGTPDPNANAQMPDPSAKTPDPNAQMPDPNDFAVVLKTLSCAFYKFTKYKLKPRKTQLIAVCMLLLSQEGNINRLLEVLTGEGKSCIIAMFAAALGMQGKKVDIVTSSPVLARRDAKKWAAFFEIFRLTADHNTETPDLLLVEQAEADKKRRECYQKTVVYGTASSFSADILREEFEMRKVRSNRGFEVAIVDEVDMLMLDEGVQFTYLSHRAAVLRHIEPVLSMVWSAVGNHTPLPTSDGDVLYAGAAKAFHIVMYESMDRAEHQLEHPTQLLQFLLMKNTSNCNCKLQHVLRTLFDSQIADTEKQGLEALSSGELTLFVKQVNKAFSLNIVAYELNQYNILEIAEGTADSEVSVLVADKGILCPLYTQDELTQGITKMISSQCDLPDQETLPNSEDQQVLHSENGSAFLRGISGHFDDVLATFIDATQLLELAEKVVDYSPQKSDAVTQFLSCKDEEKRREIMEAFTIPDVLNFLDYLQNQAELSCKMPVYYVLDDDTLRKWSKTERMDESLQDILVMDNGLLCPIFQVKPGPIDLSQATSSHDSHLEIQESQEELLYFSEDIRFKRGVPGFFHDVICSCVDCTQLLNLLMRVDDPNQRKLPDATDIKSKVRTARECVPIISSTEKYLACHLVAYTQENHNRVISHERTDSIKKGTNEKSLPEVSILVMDNGMVCQLHTKEAEVLHSENGSAFLRGISGHFDDVLATFIDATQLLELAEKVVDYSPQKSDAVTQFLSCKDEEKRREIMEAFTIPDVLNFLDYLQNQVELSCKMPVYYVLDDDTLRKWSKTERMDESLQDILVMDNGLLCPIFQVKPGPIDLSQATSSHDSHLETQESQEELLYFSEDIRFKRGVPGFFHDVICSCVDCTQLLNLLMRVDDPNQRKLPDAMDMKSKVRTARECVPIISSTEKYLACHLVAYTQENHNRVISHERTDSIKKGTNENPRREVSILVMDGGMVCQLHAKEVVEIPHSLKKFVANQLPTYINSAFIAMRLKENREYLLKDGKQIIPIDFQNSGVIEANKKWGGGLQQMLELKHHLQLSPMSVVTNFMSHVEYFQRYTRNGALYGLSGTIGGDTDAKIMRTLYQLEVTKIPTYRQSLRYERDAIFVNGERKEWLEEIHSVLKNATEPKMFSPDLLGAAALVLCEDIRTAIEIETFLKGKGHKKLTLYSRNDSKDNSSTIEETPVGSGEIIIATNLAGRGTDIPVKEEVNESGGLLCLLTFLPRNRRVELQAFGRTARCGNPGSVQYVLPVSALPCEFHCGLDMTTIRDIRENEESQRLELMLETDIKEVEVREALFHRYQEFLKDIYGAFESRNDRQVIIDTVNENWGQWLQMKQSEVGIDSKDKLLRELEVAQESWRPPPNMSPDHLPESNFHHLVKFGNELVRANRANAAQVNEMYLNHLVKIGRQIVTDEKKNAREARKYYRKAMDLEPKFTMIAAYNHACCTLCIMEGDDYIQKGIEELMEAKKQLRVLLDEVTLITQCAMMSRHSQRVEDPIDNHLLKQMEVRMQVLQYFGNQIDETVEKLKVFLKSKANPTSIRQYFESKIDDAVENVDEYLRGGKIEVLPTSILQLIPEADFVTNEELYGLYQLGLEFTFTVGKRPRFCWEGLAVFVLGIAQIVAGVCLTVFTAGALASFGMGLIAEGVSDCIDGVVGMVTGEWDWKEWGFSKACSIGVSIACGGVGKFISKGAKFIATGAKEGKVFSSVVTKTKTVFKDVTKVAVDSWGTALKGNMKNAAKLVGKELVQQGAMCVLNKVENKAIHIIFAEVGKRIAHSDKLAKSLKQSFEEEELGLVVDHMLSSDPDSSVSQSEMSSITRHKAKQYFTSAADEVVTSLVPKSEVFDKVAERFRSLLPQISGRLKGKAGAVVKLVELNFVIDSLDKAVSQLESLTEEFLPKMKEHCYGPLKGEIPDDSETKCRYSPQCVKDLKTKLAEHSADKLGEAVASVLLQNLTWMVNRGLSKTVNKVASRHLNRGLNVEGTKEMIRAGQSANYLRSMPLGTVPLDPHGEAAVKSHSDKILDSKNPGTLAELRVAAEVYGCKVVIEDEKGNRKCSLSSSSTGTKPQVTLVHLPPDGEHGQHPLGHYMVKVGGIQIDVPSANKSCMFESFAHGLKEAKKRDGSKTEEAAIDGSAVRKAVSKEISDNPELWHEHLKRREDLMRMKDGEHFLLLGAAPKVNETTKVKEGYRIEQKHDKETVITYKQDNDLKVKTVLQFDKKPEGKEVKVNKKYLEGKHAVMKVTNGAKVVKMTVEVDGASYSKNSGRCLHTLPSQDQIAFSKGQRDPGSAPVSFHLIPSEAGANAGVLFGNSVVASEHYNQLERELSKRIAEITDNKPYKCKVTVELEDLIPKCGVIEMLEARNKDPSRRQRPEVSPDQARIVEERFKQINKLVGKGRKGMEEDARRDVTAQRVKSLTYEVSIKNEKGEWVKYKDPNSLSLGRDTELYLHSSLGSENFNKNKDLEGARVLTRAPMAGPMDGPTQRRPNPGPGAKRHDDGESNS